MFFKQLLDKTRSRRVPDAAELIEAARSAPDVAARRDACRALVQLDVLWAVASDDTDPGVRDLAGARFRRLLCGLDEQAPPLAERSALVAGLDDAALLAHVAQHGVEPELRRGAIDRLHDPLLLAACAIDDPRATNRQAAAERIHDRAALEAVQKRIGNRDKGVYRLVKERLRAITEAEERPQRLRAEADAVCEKLARLGRFDNWTQDQALLQHLDREWEQIAAELGAELDAERRERRQQLRDDFRARYDAYARAHAAQLDAERARAAAAAQRADLIQALHACTELDDADAFGARLADIERDWQAADPGAATAEQRRTYGEALAAARTHGERLGTERRRHQAAEQLRRDAEQALADGELDQRRVQACTRRLETLEAAGTVPEATRAAVAGLGARFKKHREQVRRKLDTLPERLTELEGYLADGRLRQAEPIYQSIRATLEQAHDAGLPAADSADTETRLKGLAPQLKELQRWRRWGTDTHRQALCEEIERLAADTGHELEPLANRLAELQDAWRALDRSGTPAHEALWQSFRAAADTIRERCRPFYEAQSKIRAATREQRQALCERLEAFLEQVDWERMDWKKAMRAEREMRRAWAALGPEAGATGGGRRGGQRPLEGRFRKSLRRLDEALDAERARNLAERRELISQMQVLADEPDLRAAMESAKALQRRWHPTVTGRKRDENALWQEFRAAADVVFSRRNAEQNARHAELNANLATRSSICEALAKVAEQAEDAEALRAALREQQRQWHDTDALPLPKPAIQALRRRWRETLDAAERRLDALAAQARWSALDNIRRRADWCDTTAQRLAQADAGATDQAALRAEWQALPNLDDGDLVERLDQGLALILAAAGGDADALDGLRAQMQRAKQQREDLCLRLEIAAGVSSPPELESARMALQVQRLKARMGHGEDGTHVEDVWTLLREWYLLAPAATAPDLEARHEGVRQALRP
ncbi:MAG: DUF349 domain-containing protein [Thiohalocapsa sp.]|jgi:hypothetical protein|uniref:DUF349 domain-containing protein n=1 Tax=Thiohalocapsa sp. TaxID=2497641 RepID=UPI0025E0615F|nr:DUF349 domain-containing protein [Thiohalocapsa sp.]MCG6943555.1 DUF349 domain-containing protein [Thiohalocapsa sp.]